MKFFISGKFEDKENIRKLQQAVKDLGHEITEDWTYHEYSDKGYPVEYAKSDIEGVKNCDVYVGRFVADYNYKGAFVEMGVALGLGKTVYTIGHAIDSCIFIHHPNVLCFEDDYGFVLGIRNKSLIAPFVIKQNGANLS